MRLVSGSQTLRRTPTRGWNAFTPLPQADSMAFTSMDILYYPSKIPPFDGGL
jgi:hypothetical protein